MQFQKLEIKENILSAAREEFLENGFEKASIRKITAAAKTSKSNLYNYFPNKDALFCALLAPVISQINTGFDKLRIQNIGASADTYSIGAQKEVIQNIMEFVYRHESEIKMLFFCSYGSLLSDFKDKVIDVLADILYEWVSFAAPDKAITVFFTRSVAGFYIGIIEEMLKQGLTREQAAGHFEVFLKFVFGGWNTVLTLR